MTVEFDITPIGKPRMTRSDKWRTDPNHPDPRRRQRPSVTQYFAFKNELNARANLLRFELPDAFEVEFYLPVPASWTKKRRTELLGKPHQQTPDADNMLKALCDCLRVEDSGIWSVRIRKFWSNQGRIIIHV